MYPVVCTYILGDRCWGVVGGIWGHVELPVSFLGYGYTVNYNMALSSHAFDCEVFVYYHVNMDHNTVYCDKNLLKRALFVQGNQHPLITICAGLYVPTFARLETWSCSVRCNGMPLYMKLLF